MQVELNKSRAKQSALGYIRGNYSGLLTPEIIDEETIEKAYGWIFFFQSREYLGSKNFRLSLLGNGPLVIDKQDGSIHPLTTAMPSEESIAEFEETYKKAP